MPRVRRAGHRNNALLGPAKSNAKKISRVRGARLPFVPPSSPPSPYGTFSLLPPEMRIEIYALVFAAGYPALGRTSKAMHADTQGALHRYGVYRFDIDAARYDKWPEMVLPYTEKKLGHVQNVQIRIHPPRGEPYHEHELADKGDFRGMKAWTSCLAESVGRPRSCCVKFTMASYTPFVDQTLEAIWCLRRFERIEVQIYNGAWSVRNGIRSPGLKQLYPDEDIIEDVKDVLFSDDGFGEKSGVTIVQVKKHIRFNR